MLFPAIAILAREPQAVVRHARKLVTAYQFNNEPIRILMASLASGLYSTDALIGHTVQKHLLRELKLHDAAVNNKESMRWNSRNKRYMQDAGKAADGDGEEGGDDEIEEEDTGADDGPITGDLPPLPVKPNPMGVAVYGQMCCGAKSYQSAICTSVSLSRPILKQ
jgi:general transcription factor 3C polypeptide 3 (transcription factor C subunit 4)